MNNTQDYRNKYDREHYARTTILTSKETKELIKDRAKDLEKSVNEYIVDLIMEDLDKR